MPTVRNTFARVVCTAALLTGCDYAKPTDTDRLEEDMTLLAAENDSLRGRLDSLSAVTRSDVEQLQTDVGEMSEDISSLQAGIDSLGVVRGEIVDIKVALAEVELVFAVSGVRLVYEDTVRVGDTLLRDITFTEIHVVPLRVESEGEVEIRVEGRGDIFFALIRQGDVSLEVVASYLDQDFPSESSEYSDLSIFEDHLTAGVYLILIQTWLEFETDSYRLSVGSQLQS